MSSLTDPFVPHDPHRPGWLGVRVTTQAEADKRVPQLLEAEAAVRFVLATPREALDLRALLCRPDIGNPKRDPNEMGYVTNTFKCARCKSTVAKASVGNDAGVRYANQLAREAWSIHIAENGIALVVVRGETGPAARRLHPDWVRALRDQAVAAGVPFSFDGWGDWAPCSEVAISARRLRIAMCIHGFAAEFDREAMKAACSECRRWEAFARVGAERAGRRLDGREWDEAPAAPAEEGGAA